MAHLKTFELRVKELEEFEEENNVLKKRMGEATDALINKETELALALRELDDSKASNIIQKKEVDDLEA